MTRKLKSLAALGAVAVLTLVASVVPAGAASPGVVVTMNPSGGTAPGSGLKIIYSGGQFQVYRDGSAQVYDGELEPPAIGIYNQIALAVGDPTNGGTTLAPQEVIDVVDDTFMTASNVTLQGWDVVTTPSSATGFTSVLTGVVNGLTYTVTYAVNYTAPDVFFTGTYTVEIPAGNTAQVRLYHLVDSLLGASDQGAGFYNSSTACPDGSTLQPSVGVSDADATIFEQFTFLSGLPWTGYASTNYANVVFSNDGYGPGYMSDLTNVINPDPTTDNGFGFSLDLGTSAGTYVTSSELSFNTENTNVCPPVPEPVGPSFTG